MQVNTEFLSIERIYSALLLGFQCISNNFKRLDNPFVCHIDKISFKNKSQLELHNKEKHMMNLNVEENIRWRLEIINPLIELVNPTLEDIKRVARRNNVYWTTIYNWWKGYNNGGLQGLKSKTHLRGRKTKEFPSGFKTLLSQSINNYVLNENEKSIKSLVNELHKKVDEFGLSTKDVSYSTIRRYILKKKKEIDNL